MVKKANFEIIVGTYEEYLLGYYFTSKEGKLTQSFASHDHSSSIRCIAASEPFLASGAADDRVIIYDLKARKEHCMLTHHESTITGLAFTKNHSHVISAGSDGALAIVRVGNWQLEKLWEKAHDGAPLQAISVHESGKLALTLGADCTLRTWNLIKGRAAYIINLNSKCKDARSLENILWAPDTVRFVLYGGKYTEIWSIDTGGALKVIEHNCKVSSCVWLNDEVLLAGYENGELAEIAVTSGKINTHKAHENRIKCVTKFKKWIITGASNGELKVWDKNFEEQAKINTGCRITCMCAMAVLKETEKETLKDSEEVTLKNMQNSKKPVFGLVVEIEDEDDEVPVNRSLKSNKKKHKPTENEQDVKKTKKRKDELTDSKTKNRKKKKGNATIS